MPQIMNQKILKKVTSQLKIFKFFFSKKIHLFLFHKFKCIFAYIVRGLFAFLVPTRTKSPGTGINDNYKQ